MTSTALVLRSDGIGGLLTVVPALRALRRHGLRVVLACPPELSELAALTGAVDRILPAYGLAPLSWPGPGEEDADHPRSCRTSASTCTAAGRAVTASC
ncbi:hypothetical protein GCM10027612_76160 [Microbispora bryophytorum subsp. camponoti]